MKIPKKVPTSAAPTFSPICSIGPEIADIVNLNAPLAVRGTRLAILKGLDLPLHEAEMLAESFRERNLHTEDSLEGPKAFAEKRPPEWQCR